MRAQVLVSWPHQGTLCFTLTSLFLWEYYYTSLYLQYSITHLCIFNVVLSTPPACVLHFTYISVLCISHMLVWTIHHISLCYFNLITPIYGVHEPHVFVFYILHMRVLHWPYLLVLSRYHVRVLFFFTCGTFTTFLGCPYNTNSLCS
jgi:hypothetical protein